MKVEVVTPEDFMGDVIGDLNSRRGQVQNMDMRGNARVVTAMVPMFTCGLVRSNFALATVGSSSFRSVRLSRIGVLVLIYGLFFDPRLFAASFRDDLRRHVLRNLGVGVELHGVTSPALGPAAQVTHVTEHL